jgi:excisionase family DNA binding protein
MSELLKAADVCRLLNVSQSTLRRVVERGELAPIKIGKHVRFRSEDVSSLIERKVSNGR